MTVPARLGYVERDHTFRVLCVGIIQWAWVSTALSHIFEET